jgi:uncharacterized protein YecE (DUF72 family)
LKLLPKEISGLGLRHVVEVRHESFRTAAFIDLARSFDVGIVIAGDSQYPQIADPTAPFVYARIMGTQAKETCGYGEPALERWAKRARSWAAGESPTDLTYVESPKPDGKPRDVYLYVISGHKAHNPAAAMALIKRIH